MPNTSGFSLNDDNDFIYGLGWRTIETDMTNTDSIQFYPEDKRQHLFNAFLQNTTALNERLSLMLGSKFEHNDMSGFEIQPSLRLNYLLGDDSQLWFSVSRAVRTPSLVEHDINVRNTVSAGGGLLGAAWLRGDDDSVSEEVISWETGFRSQLTEDWAIDIAVFYNEYDKLGSFQDTGPNPLELEHEDTDTAESYGVELQSIDDISEDWDVTFSYTYFKQVIHGTNRGTSKSSKDYYPHNMFNILSNYKITDSLSFHTALYYYDRVNTFDIPSYIKLDAGFIWEVNDQMELQVWGKNLLEPSHREFRDDLFEDEPHQIERSAYVQFTYRF